MLGVGVAAVIVLAVVLKRPSRTVLGEGGTSGSGRGGRGAEVFGSGEGNGGWRRPMGGVRRSIGGEGEKPAETIVAERAVDFTRSRKQMVQGMARQLGVEVPAEMEQFFAALEAGEFREAKGFFNRLESMQADPNVPAGVKALLAAAADVFGVAAVAKSWPAGELLAYGESVLAALRPGTVYIAGTDAGRYIPSLLNEGAGGGRPLVLSLKNVGQPGFFEYLNALHGGSLVAPGAEELAAAGGGKAPNPEDLLRVLMEKNPGVNFAFEGTLQLNSLVGAAMPLGPIMELGVPNAGAGRVSATTAAESVAYWEATAQRLQGATELGPDAEARQAYAHLAGAQAEVMAGANHVAEAEQAFRAALSIAPGAFAPVEQYASFLAKTGRMEEALKVTGAFAENHPAYRGAVEALAAKWTPK